MQVNTLLCWSYTDNAKVIDVIKHVYLSRRGICFSDQEKY